MENCKEIFLLVAKLLLEWTPFLAVMASFYAVYKAGKANESVVKQSEEANKRMIKHQQNLERHKWINEFRESVAEYIASVSDIYSYIQQLFINSSKERAFTKKDMIEVHSKLQRVTTKVILMIREGNEKEEQLKKLLEDLISFMNNNFFGSAA